VVYAIPRPGYYDFSFASYDDLRSIWAAGTINLKSSVLRLFEWTKDFNAHTQRQTYQCLDKIVGIATRILDGVNVV